MVKIETGIVRPSKPLFYCRYNDDIYSRYTKDEFDNLFHALSNYHKNINLTS